jgi:protoheme ferro-lyase
MFVHLIVNLLFPEGGELPLYHFGVAIETIQNTMQILRLHKKGPHLKTLERFHIYTEYVNNNNHINDNQTVFPNRLFDVLLNAHSNPPPTHSTP